MLLYESLDHTPAEPYDMMATKTPQLIKASFALYKYYDIILNLVSKEQSSSRIQIWQILSFLDTLSPFWSQTQLTLTI